VANPPRLTIQIPCVECRHSDRLTGMCSAGDEPVDLRWARDLCPAALSIARATRDAWRRNGRSGLVGTVHYERDGAPVCGAPVVVEERRTVTPMSNDGGSVTCAECWWAIERRRS
jgi:hypothetical protein